MDRQEANAELATLVTEIRDKLQRAEELAVSHSLTFDITATSRNGNTIYTHHIERTKWGEYAVWTSSSWDDSGCSIEDWEDSGC